MHTQTFHPSALDLFVKQSSYPGNLDWKPNICRFQRCRSPHDIVCKGQRRLLPPLHGREKRGKDTYTYSVLYTIRFLDVAHRAHDWFGPLSGGSGRTERVFFAFFKLSQSCWLEINRQVHVNVVGFTYSVLCVCLGVVELGAINHSDGNGTGRYILQAKSGIWPPARYPIKPWQQDCNTRLHTERVGAD